MDHRLNLFDFIQVLELFEGCGVCHIMTIISLIVTVSSSVHPFLLMHIKFQAQADEIAGICQRTALAPDELAARVAIKSETMRKIARGYQKPQRSFCRLCEMWSWLSASRGLCG